MDNLKKKLEKLVPAPNHTAICILPAQLSIKRFFSYFIWFTTLFLDIKVVLVEKIFVKIGFLFNDLAQ